MTKRQNNIPMDLGKSNFSTINHHFMDDSNEEFFQNSNRINPIKNTTLDKSSSEEKLFSLLQDNKQNITNNIDSAKKVGFLADTIGRRSREYYSRNKKLLSDQEKDNIEETLAANKPEGSTNPSFDSLKEKAISDIEKSQRKIIDAMFQMKSIDQALTSNGNARATKMKDSVVEQGKVLMQDLNSMSENISNGVSHNNAIREELKNRNVSLYPEELGNTMQDEF